MSLFLLLFCALPSRTEEPATDVLTRFLDEQTFAVVRADMNKLKPEDITTQIAALTGNNRDGSHALDEFKALHSLFTKAGVREVYLVASLADLPSQLPFIVVRVADPARAARQLAESKLIPTYQFQAVGPVVVGASPLTLERLQRQQGTPRPEFGTALLAAGDTAVRVAVALSADQRRVIESLVPTLPADLGGGSTQTLTRGLRWVAVGFQPPPELSLRIIVQAPDAAAAQAVSDLLSRSLKEVITRLQASKVHPQLPDFDRLAAQMKPQVEGDRVIVAPDTNSLLSLVAPLAARMQQASGRMQSTNNLKQIGLAMHSYHDAHHTFPPVANFSKDGKPLLSWRVHLLPYLEAADLYKEFRLDEPWDSEHNKKLIPRMPAVFRSPTSHAEPGKTTYLVPVGEAMIFTGGPNGTPIRTINDGTSNTILAVEVNDEMAVTWTKPADWKPDPQKPLTGLVSAYPTGFPALFADASVHFLPATIDPKHLMAMLTRSGGEVIPKD